MAKRAGSAAFKAFGHWNAVNTLAGNDVLRWQEVMALPYEYVLTKLIMNKTQTAYEKRYNDILTARRKENNKPEHTEPNPVRSRVKSK